MYKKGIVWWQILIGVGILIVAITVSFILGRISKEAEFRDTITKALNSSTSTVNNTNSSTSTSTNSSTTSNNTTKTSSSKTSIAEIKLNEPYIITNSYGEYSITFEGVRETQDRNQFSDVNPNKVIFVDYNYENISSETDVYVSSMSYKVMDDSGNVLDTYPVSDSTRNNNAVPMGGKSKGCDAFAIMTDTKTITILYYDYGSKPLGRLVVQL